MLGQPAVTTEDQAEEVLIKWFRDQGYNGEIRISYSYGQKYDSGGQSYFDFDVIRPYGVYYVQENGVVSPKCGMFQTG